MDFFIEAETFGDLGGWVVDTQCREAMGSFWIMAHGLGKPVRDATTKIDVGESAIFRVWARTRDWSRIWGRGKPAGRFKILVDGRELGRELGTNGERWSWQEAGTVSLEKGEHLLSLRDLTGFNGRCDALYLTDDLDFAPPDGGEELSLFRREKTHAAVAEDPVLYDLIVAGGGMAGACAAISAEKSGLRVLLLHDRAVLGGCGSSEVRVWTGGAVCRGQYSNLGKVAAALSPLCGTPGMRKDASLFEDARKAAFFTPGRNLLMEEAVIGVNSSKGRIESVVTRSVRTGRETLRRSRYFVDATGDGFLARMAGAETMYGSEGRGEYGEFLAPPERENTVMGHSTLWETKSHPHPVPFPDIDWGIEFTEETALKRFDCCWDWETGQFRNQVYDIEYIRDYGLMSCFANWSFLKNRSKDKDKWANLELEWISPIGGKRESYRIKGDMVLTQNDILSGKEYEDATGEMTWSIDLHYADPENRRIFGEAFQSCAYHLGLPKAYGVPYRTMYPSNVDNLFLAGRILSMTHVAFSSVRVMRTLGMLAEVAGMAAAIAAKYGCTAREVGSMHLDELKGMMQRGIDMRLPNAWDAGEQECYHFMRPIGQYGNRDENCWVHFDREGKPRWNPDPRLLALADELGIARKSYGQMEREEKERGQ